MVGLVLLGVVAALSARTAVAVKRSVQSVEARWPGLVVARRELERGVRVPVLRGSARDENAALRYLDLLPRIDPEIEDLLEVSADPSALISSGTLAALESHAAVLSTLREVLSCSRCDWATAYEAPFEARPRLGPLASLSALLVADGHRRAQAGDSRGAAERYLDAIRLSADLSRNWQTPDEASLALEGLGRLVASDAAGRLDLAVIEAELDLAMSAFPAPADELAQHRLEALGVLLRASTTPDPLRTIGADCPWWAKPIVVRQALAASALAELESRWDAAALALQQGDVEAFARDAEAIHHHGGSESNYLEVPSWNPVSLVLDPSLVVHVSDRHRSRLARAAFVRGAIALERARATGGAAPTPPDDPFHPGTPLEVDLHSAGPGYRLSTPGPHRLGCFGGPQDRSIALERRP